MAVARAIAIADEQVTAWHLFEHEGKVFAARQGATLAHHLVSPHQFFGHIAGEVGLGQVVHQHGVTALVVDVGADPIALGLGVNQLGDAFLQQDANIAVQRAHAQAQRCGLRDHVVGHARIERADRDDGHLLRVDVAGHDALQAHDDGRARHHRVSGHMRHGAVPTFAVQGDGDVVRGRHGRAVAQDQVALRVGGHVVHGKDGITRKLLEQAVFHHLLGPTQAFFCGLKNQVDGAREHPFLSDVFGRRQQHGGVPVVTAGVHDAHVATGIRQAGGLVNRQGVHVGANTYGAVARAFFDLTDQTGAAQTACHLVAPGAQLLGHQVAGAVLLVAHLGVLVNVAAHRNEFIR